MRYTSASSDWKNLLFKPGCNVVNAKKIVYNKVYG